MSNLRAKQAAYIGILTEGTTSRMRAEALRSLRPDWNWHWIDTDLPMKASSRVWRSCAFRWKRGPVVRDINQQITDAIAGHHYDLLWVDKAVFLTRNVSELLRRISVRMIHYTPDTAFHENQSYHFNQSIGLYDLLVTTKSFELNDYTTRLSNANRVILVTQGFDPRVHRPIASAGPRRRGVAFVGLAEPDRFRCIRRLLAEGIPVHLGGMGWEEFARRHSHLQHFHYLGPKVFGDQYAELYSSVWIGLGLLSKRFPELHTTRTFEIPACGAILATPETSDTTNLFVADEAIFYVDAEGLAGRVKKLFASKSDSELGEIASKGRSRVLADRRDYVGILDSALADPRISLS